MGQRLNLDLTTLLHMLDEFDTNLPWPTLEAHFAQAMNTIGFQNFIFTIYAEDFIQTQQVVYETYSPALIAWFKHFWDSGYDGHDPIGQKARTSNNAVTWNLAKLAERYTGKSRRLFRDALDFGLKAGFSQALYTANGQFSILVGYFESPSDLETTQANHQIHLANLVAKAYHTIVNKKLLQNAEPIKLTKREQQVLQLMTQSLTTKVIGEQLHISERTANFHIDNIKFKLNVNGKQQAIIKAASLGLIRL